MSTTKVRHNALYDQEVKLRSSFLEEKLGVSSR